MMTAFRTFAVAATLLALVAGVANANPITYVFEPGAYVDIGHGKFTRDAITGSFMFDASTDTETNVDIMIGSDDYTELSRGGLSGDQIIADDGALEVTFTFDTDLGVGTDDLGGVLITVGKGAAESTGAFGGTAASVPEPGTLALFGAALLALGGLGLRRKFV
jgi:hypothetical protein